LRDSRKGADDCQGESGTRGSAEKARKLFEIKILTSNPYALKILQSFFAKPAPVAVSQKVGGGGYSSYRRFSQNGNCLKLMARREISSAVFHIRRMFSTFKGVHQSRFSNHTISNHPIDNAFN